MSSTTETGHAKNAANFEQLISFCTGYGTNYKPAKAVLNIESLNAMLNAARSAISDVNSAMPAYSNAIAAREVAFEPLNKLTTRVLNALKATDTTDNVDENARTFVRKIQGRRASAKLTDEEKQALAAQGKEQKENSASQFSYDSRLDNLDKLLKLLGSIPEYAPNETELNLGSLNKMFDNLKAKNSAVIDAATPLSNLRITRDQVLYAENKGLVDIALDVKLYVKSVYGANSPQFKQVSGLEFKRVA